MALTLNAEQKFIIDIFSGKNQYIIPPYQRAYSWDKEQCYELFEDLVKAYEEDCDEGYFLGNIVIAKSNEHKNSLEVIDGQQRLITLTLFIKVLFEYDQGNRDLENAIWIPAKRDGENKVQRLKTRVFEEKDSKFLSEVLNNDLNNICKNINKENENKFKQNICFLKKHLDIFSNNYSIDNFIEFFMEKVSLLPIETNDQDQEKAREKALKIFESINSRGKDLSSSDIFKARLYSMALNKNKSEEFIDQWNCFAKECDDLDDAKYTIDRIFKIYTYIIRGSNGTDKSEVGLMSFFTVSFFKDKNYEVIMKDLITIVEQIQFFKEVIVTTNYNDLTKWFQLINEYTNNFPKDTLIVYLFRNKSNDYLKPNLTEFSKNLVRYCYFKGSTASIKYEMYKLTIKIMNNDDFAYEYYPDMYEDRNYDFFGRLYKGFGLLSLYINEKQKPIYPYYIKRLRDVTRYKYRHYSYYDEVGHTSIVNNKKEPIESIDFINFDNNSYRIRQKDIKNNLINFFKRP